MRPQSIGKSCAAFFLKASDRALVATHRLKMTGGGEVVGKIPRGLPELSMPKINYDIITHLLPYAVIISLLGFMEAVSVAKAMAAITGQRLDPNRQKLPDFRIFLPIGCKPAVRSNFQPVQRIHQSGGGGRSFVFYAAFVPSAAIRAGGNYHDGRRRVGQRQGIYTCMEGAVV
jgi:hypothetical protein